MTTVFLSSTAQDLKEYRLAAAEAIERFGYRCEKMEVMGASTAPTIDVCCKKVRASQLYVGVLAYSYGTVPTVGRVTPDDDRSYTEIEYDTAVEAGIPRLLFIADAEKHFPVNPYKLTLADRQKAFRERAAAAGQPVAFFGTPEELKTYIVQAIHLWEKERRSSQTARPGARFADSAVQRLHRTFATAQAHIWDLYYLKNLHDELHTLPKNCLAPLMDQVKLFPAVNHDSVEGADFNLEGALVELRGQVDARRIGGFEMDWVSTLEGSRADMKGALADGDARKFRRAVNNVRVVLETQPVVINAAMKSTAKALNLRELAGAIDAVLASEEEGLSDEDTVRLRACSERVAGLSARLEELVSTHDAWQLVDKELRPIEANLRSDFGVMQLRDNWPYLKDLAEPLAAGFPELQEETVKLDTALGGEDRGAIENSFKKFLNRAFFAFLHVDAILKDFCGRQLTELTDPLVPATEAR